VVVGNRRIGATHVRQGTDCDGGARVPYFVMSWGAQRIAVGALALAALLCACPQILDDNFTNLEPQARGAGGQTAADPPTGGAGEPPADMSDTSSGGLDSGSQDSDTASFAGNAGDAGELPLNAGPGRPCAGVAALAACWYLGKYGESCTQTCGGHGGFDPQTTRLMGVATQGGSIDNCKGVMTALRGTPTIVSNGTRPTGQGIGCHLFGSANPQAWWLRSPDFSPDAAVGNSSLACSCLE